MNSRDIRKITVLGGGVIGSSWSTYFLWKGLDVTIYDVNDGALALARDRLASNLAYLNEKKVISKSKANAFLKKAVFTADIRDALKNAQFVQESGPENYEVKQSLVAALDEHGPADAIFASSTSGLLITEIAKFSKHPERCIGAHPYNPPHLIPLVEINRGDRTAPAFLLKAYGFYKSIGKEPVILKKEALGFISNRLQIALYREAVDLVLRGVCSVEDIDKAVSYGPGLRFALMGPNMIFHLGGGKVGLKGLLEHVGPSIEMWLADMAVWKKFPEGSRDILQKQVLEELANRNPDEGNTEEEVLRWRDDMLIKLLQLLKRM